MLILIGILLCVYLIDIKPLEYYWFVRIMCVYFIDAQILNFSVDTDSQLYLPIPIKEFHFLKKKTIPGTLSFGISQ